MAKSATMQGGAAQRPTAIAWMSLKEASELTGRSRAELRSQIAAGELTARTIRRGDKVEHRLTRAALAESGLIGASVPREAPVAPQQAAATQASASADVAPDTMAQLIALIREQNERIAHLEDHRAQLAARLGATVEAMHQLEDRLEVILDARAVPATPAANAEALPITTDDGLVVPASTGRSVGMAAAERPSQTHQLNGVRRSLSRLVREVAQPRLRELTGGPRREAAPGD